MLISIPLFCCHFYIKSLYGETTFQLSDILCFSAFVTTVTALTAFSRDVVRLPAAALLQGLWFALFFLSHSSVSKKQIMAYCVSALPVIFLLALLEDKEKKLDTSSRQEKKKKYRQKKSKLSSQRQTVVRWVVCVFFIALAICLIRFLVNRNSHINLKTDSAGACLLAALCFIAYCLARISKKRFPGQKTAFHFLLSLGLFTVLNGLSYFMYFQRATNTTLPFVFPAFLAMVLFFDYNKKIWSYISVR